MHCDSTPLTGKEQRSESPDRTGCVPHTPQKPHPLYTRRLQHPHACRQQLGPMHGQMHSPNMPQYHPRMMGGCPELAVRCTAASSSRFFRREFSNALAGTTDGWCPGIIPRYQTSRGELHGRCRTNTRYTACGILLSCSIFPCTLQCYGILELSCTFYVNACCLRGESNSPVTTAGMPCPGLEAG